MRKGRQDYRQDCRRAVVDWCPLRGGGALELTRCCLIEKDDANKVVDSRPLETVRAAECRRWHDVAELVGGVFFIVAALLWGAFAPFPWLSKWFVTMLIMIGGGRMFRQGWHDHKRLTVTMSDDGRPKEYEASRWVGLEAFTARLNASAVACRTRRDFRVVSRRAS